MGLVHRIERTVVIHDLATQESGDDPELFIGARAPFGRVQSGCGELAGVFAANCWDERTARNAREHNHANVLTLGAGHLDASSAHSVVETFLSTPVGEGRHARRVGLIRGLEAQA